VQAGDSLAAGVSAFIIGQAVWAAALLPIGFINAANLLLIITFLIGEILYRHFTGKVTRNFLVQAAVLFLAISILIFWISSWKLNI